MKRLRNLLTCCALLAAALAALLWHGVPLPPFLWKPALAQWSDSHSIEVSVRDAVLALGPEPRIKLIDLAVGSDTLPDGPDRIGIVELCLNRWWPPYTASAVGSLHIKGAQIWVRPHSPMKDLFAAPMDTTAQRTALPPLPAMRFESSILNWRWPGLPLGQHRIDRMVLVPDGSEPSSLGAQWLKPGEPDTTKIEIQALVQTQGSKLRVAHLDANTSGPSRGHPWVGLLQWDEALWDRTGLGLNVNRLRAYLRRDDAPDDHQASLNIGQLLAKDHQLHLLDSEWTYTQAHAFAWTFNGFLNMGTGEFKVEPVRLPGSEALLAPVAQWHVPCPADAAGARWVWRNGWFEWDEKGDLPGAVLACKAGKPVQSKS